MHLHKSKTTLTLYITLSTNSTCTQRQNLLAQLLFGAWNDRFAKRVTLAVSKESSHASRGLFEVFLRTTTTAAHFTNCPCLSERAKRIYLCVCVWWRKKSSGGSSGSFCGFWCQCEVCGWWDGVSFCKSTLSVNVCWTLKQHLEGI